MIIFPKKELILMLSLFLTLTACAKRPEAPLSPSVKIAIEKKGDAKVFVVNFSCGLKNENDSMAFTGIDGIFVIKNSSSSVVLTVPFKMDVILPFETAIIQEAIVLTPDQITPLLDLLSIKKDQLESGDEPGSRFIEDQNISINKLEMGKTDIIDLLRSKLK